IGHRLFGLHPSPKPLSNVPDGARAILIVRPDHIFQSDAYGLIQKGGIGGESLDRFSTACKSNPLASFERITLFVAGSGASTQDNLGFIAQGKYDLAGLVECAQAMAPDGRPFEQAEFLDRPAIRGGQGNSIAVFANERTILGGSPENLKEIAATLRREGGAGSGNRLLGNAFHAVGEGDLVLLTYVAPAWMKQARAIVSRVFESWTIPTSVMVVMVGLSVDLQDGLSATVALHCRGKTEAGELASALEQLIEGELTESLGVLAPILSTLSVEEAGAHVKIRFRLSAEQLDAAVTLGRRVLGAAAGESTEAISQPVDAGIAP
ncbi:MAG: hypothetical protein KC416_11585, partial [Myxococcales bacterium]|nr:hypothetical protein [Myxococcales bacterium]